MPSGILWMDRNIGDSSTEDYGLYFVWGETQGYTVDEVSSARKIILEYYKHYDKETDSYTKYNSTDNLTTLELSDDAAYAYTKGKAKMPTPTQLDELLEYTTTTWATQNDVNGRLFTSTTNGNLIFVTAAGFGNTSMYGVGTTFNLMERFFG